MTETTDGVQQSVKHAGICAGLFSAAGLLSVLGLATLVAAGVAALARGAKVAGKMMGKGLISGAFLVLRGQDRVVGEGVMKLAGEAERA